METTRMLQRLMAPGGHSHFGGAPGWKGGFSEEALTLINDNCFSFDYMGAAEFEGGQVPRALDRIIKNIVKYELFHIEGYGSVDDIEWRPREEERDVGELPPLLAFAPKDMQEYVQALAIKMWSHEYRDFKEEPGLQAWVKYPDIRDTWIAIGWLDLDNALLMFVDGPVCVKAIDFLREQNGTVGENWLVG
jgi:hypothetical protein